ncbi:MAG: tetratricopeptide repeat protein [Acidobacteriota bacterium]
MREPEVERWLFTAQQQMQQGQLEGAVDSLRQVLSADPDDSDAHALLAMCLLDLRRLHAAEHESGMALALEPQSSLALYASGLVLAARRKFLPAEERFRQLLEQDPHNSAYYRSLAGIYQLTGRRAEALPLLEKALEIDPNDPDNLVDLGEAHLATGAVAVAEQRAQEALELLPEHHGALILMGRVLLHKDRLDEAREHAVWALRNDPTSRDALALMAQIKARSSLVLGLWWRYATWMGSLGDGRSILVLLAAYVLYRVGVITAEVMTHEGLANFITLLWLSIVAYTWFGPALFNQALRKELQTVTLGKDF